MHLKLGSVLPNSPKPDEASTPTVELSVDIKPTNSDLAQTSRENIKPDQSGSPKQDSTEDNPSISTKELFAHSDMVNPNSGNTSESDRLKLESENKESSLDNKQSLSTPVLEDSKDEQNSGQVTKISIGSSNVQQNDPLVFHNKVQKKMPKQLKSLRTISSGNKRKQSNIFKDAWLEQHLATRPNNSSNENSARHTCTICQKSFPDAGLLSVHEWVHGSVADPLKIEGSPRVEAIATVNIKVEPPDVKTESFHPELLTKDPLGLDSSLVKEELQEMKEECDAMTIVEHINEY